MKIVFKGLAGLLKDLNTFAGEAVLEESRKVVKRNGSQLEQHAKRIVPVDTGMLKRSINGVLSDGGLTSTVEPSTDYQAYVEYGTRFMDAQPYMRPSFYKQEEIFKKDMDRVIEKARRG